MSTASTTFYYQDGTSSSQLLTVVTNSSYSNTSNLTAVVIGTAVQTIQQQAFQSRHFLSTVTFNSPSNLISIQDLAFYDCIGLLSIIIPSSVQTISNQAFRGCIELTSVTFESGSLLTTIGSQAFQGSKMTTFQMPASVTSIASAVFQLSSRLSVFYWENQNNLSSAGFYNFFNNPPTAVTYFLTASEGNLTGASFQLKLQYPSSPTV